MGSTAETIWHYPTGAGLSSDPPTQSPTSSPTANLTGSTAPEAYPTKDFKGSLLINENDCLDSKQNQVSSTMNCGFYFFFFFFTNVNIKTGNIFNNDGNWGVVNSQFTCRSEVTP